MKGVYGGIVTGGFIQGRCIGGYESWIENASKRFDGHIYKNIPPKDKLSKAILENDDIDAAFLLYEDFTDSANWNDFDRDDYFHNDKRI